MYFGNYTRLVYLAQTDDPGLVEHAQAVRAGSGSTHVRAPGTANSRPHGRAHTEPVMSDDISDRTRSGRMRERQSTRRDGEVAAGPRSTIYWRDIPAQLTARGADEQQQGAAARPVPARDRSCRRGCRVDVDRRLRQRVAHPSAPLATATQAKLDSAAPNRDQYPGPTRSHRRQRRPRDVRLRRPCVHT